MQTDLFLKDEKVLSLAASGNVVFTNKRIILNKSSKSNSILLEKVKRIEIVNKRNTILGAVALSLTLAAIYFGFVKELILLAVFAFASIISLATYCYKRKAYLRVSSEKADDILLETEKIEKDAKVLLNLLECARFERLNDLFKSSNNAKDAPDPKTIKISA